jgi:hypothetical protein
MALASDEQHPIKVGLQALHAKGESRKKNLAGNHRLTRSGGGEFDAVLGHNGIHVIVAIILSVVRLLRVVSTPQTLTQSRAA